MSLSYEEIENTKKELKSNFDKSGLTVEEIADKIKTTPEYVEDLFNINPRRPEDTWILKNYLIEVLNEKSVEVTPFTALRGNCEDNWFLNSDYIKNGAIR